MSQRAGYNRPCVPIGSVAAGHTGHVGRFDPFSPLVRGRPEDAANPQERQGLLVREGAVAERGLITLGVGAFLGDAVRDAEEADRGDQADAADDVAQG